MYIPPILIILPLIWTIKLWFWMCKMVILLVWQVVKLLFVIVKLILVALWLLIVWCARKVRDLYWTIQDRRHRRKHVRAVQAGTAPQISAAPSITHVPVVRRDELNVM